MMLAEWEKNAKPGDMFIYYTGHLAADSDPLQAPKHTALEVGAIGQAAYAMYRTGCYELMQRRSTDIPSLFEYMIIKRRKRDPIPRAGMVHDIRRYQTSKPRWEE